MRTMRTINNEPFPGVVDLQCRYLDGVGAHVGPRRRHQTEADERRSIDVLLVVERVDSVTEVGVAF